MRNLTEGGRDISTSQAALRKCKRHLRFVARGQGGNFECYPTSANLA
jgi:hypothetical protein